MKHQLSKEFLQYLNNRIKNLGLSKSEIVEVKVISGGSINRTFAVFTLKEKFFLKINSASKFPQLFQKEERGLGLLKKSMNLHLPEVLLNGEYGDTSFLLMELILFEKQSNLFWENFGIGLAKLHQVYGEKFGLNENNYIGSLEQLNSYKKDWASFFIENRLEHQANLAFDKGLIDSELITQLERLYQKVESIFPVELPSLLHGDLWSGNFIVGSDGQAVLIDPAVYYGNREMDIAMTHLFGGFDKRFIKAYNSCNPLKADWEKRIEVCNIYPLLVHVNLFGQAYVSRLKSVLKKLV